MRRQGSLSDAQFRIRKPVRVPVVMGRMRFMSGLKVRQKADWFTLTRHTLALVVVRFEEARSMR